MSSEFTPTPSSSQPQHSSQPVKQNASWYTTLLSYFPSAAPGPLEQIHAPLKNIQTSHLQIDGAQFNITRNVKTPTITQQQLGQGSMVSVSNLCNMGNQSMWQLQTAWTRLDHAAYAIGSYDTEGSIVARGQMPYNNTIFKALGHYSKMQGNTFTLEAEHTGSCYTATAKIAAQDIFNSIPILNASIFHSLTKSIAIGGDLTRMQQRGGEQQLVMSLAARSKLRNDDLLSVTASPTDGITASYYRKLNGRMELGSELLFAQDPQNGQILSVGSVASKLSFRHGSTLRMQGTSERKVSVVLEEQIMPNAMMTLSSELDHGKGAFRFGVGMNIEL